MRNLERPRLHRHPGESVLRQCAARSGLADHALSGSIDYEPSRLNGRRGFSNTDETTTHFGLAASYTPTKNWLISGTYDYDNVSSGDITREYTRNRYGVNATYSF